MIAESIPGGSQSFTGQSPEQCDPSPGTPPSVTATAQCSGTLEGEQRRVGQEWGSEFGQERTQGVTVRRNSQSGMGCGG